MQLYVVQLLEDLKNAERSEQEADTAESEQSFEQHIQEVERWLEQGEPEHVFSYYCGLQKEIFPPAEKLSTQHLILLVKGLKKLLFSWNINVDMPDELEIDKVYTLIVGVLDRKIEIVESGFITLEFCTYDVPSCPFGEHCMCKQYDTDFDDDNDVSLNSGF